jgi:hypothetical protein
MRGFIAALAAVTIAAVPTASASAKPSSHAKTQTCYAWATVVIKQPRQLQGVDSVVTVMGMMTTRQEVLTYRPVLTSGCTVVPHKHHTWVIQSTTVPYSEAYNGNNDKRQVSVSITPIHPCIPVRAYGEPTGSCATPSG